MKLLVAVASLFSTAGCTTHLVYELRGPSLDLGCCKLKYQFVPIRETVDSSGKKNVYGDGAYSVVVKAVEIQPQCIGKTLTLKSNLIEAEGVAFDSSPQKIAPPSGATEFVVFYAERVQLKHQNYWLNAHVVLRGENGEVLLEKTFGEGVEAVKKEYESNKFIDSH